MAGRSIFRETAIAAYRRGQDRDVLPRLTSWPVVACCWLSLGILVTAAVLAFAVRVPTYMSASGVILRPGVQIGNDGRGTAVALFVPPEQAGQVRIGRPVHGQLGQSGEYLQGAVVTVEPGVIGPDAVRTRYGFDGASEVTAQPSTVVIVQLDRTLPPVAYGGSLLSAQIETGTQRLLAYFPGMEHFLGGES